VPSNGEGRAPRQRPGPAPTFTATYGPAILPDPYGIRLAARERIWAQHRQRRISSQLEHVVSLARYYGPRRARPVPLSQFLAEGWWWAA
jgi:hypothetical protein